MEDFTIWKPVVGHPGYEVNDRGQVRSIDRVSKGRRYKGRSLRPGQMSTGHVSVAIGKGNSRTVHSLVLEAFTGPVPEGCEARHLNGVPHDNRWENLVWDDRGENTRDKKHHDGQRNRLMISEVREIKYGPLSASDAATKFGIHQWTVYNIRGGHAHGEVDPNG